LFFSASNIKPTVNYNRAFGLSIRCIKNSANQNINPEKTILNTINNKTKTNKYNELKIEKFFNDKKNDEAIETITESISNSQNILNNSIKKLE
jgi:hypothetical protein